MPLAASETGEQIAERECAECHGHRGRSDQPDMPSVGGFSEFATMDLLDSYRLGFRQPRTVALDDGSETDMAQIVTDRTKKHYDTLSAGDKLALLEFYVSAGRF